MTRLAALDPARYGLDSDLAARVLTPALAVHLDLVRQNVRTVIQHLGGDVSRWRPHVKTTKLPAVWRVLAEEGVRSFKCATTRELAVLLETLGKANAADADVLVAYPHRPPALGRIAAIAAEHPDAAVSVLIEDPDVVPEVPANLWMFVDVNPGMNRTGVPDRDESTLLELVRAAGPRYRGLHWYDGHLHDADLASRRAAVERGLARALELIDLIEREQGAITAELISSGTPAFLSSLDSAAASARPGLVHRVSPGTVVFHDVRSQLENAELGLVPAAVVLTRVISHPADDLATCDAGSKSIAAEAGDPVVEVIGRPDMLAQRPSEEHLPFRVDPAARPERGELFALVPMHVCPTVNLAEEALLFDHGEFLGVAKVAARAHELLIP